MGDTNFTIKRERGELRLRMATKDGFFTLSRGNDLLLKVPGSLPVSVAKPFIDEIYNMLMPETNLVAG